MMILAMILELFPGIRDPFFSQTLKKPKENQCFWLRTLKNLRKINVFAFPEHLVTQGAPLGLPRPKNIYHKLPIHRPSGRYVKKHRKAVAVFSITKQTQLLLCFLSW